MTLLAQVIRSGVVEAEHRGAVAVVDRHGELVGAHGDIDRSYYARSSVKPFQATISLESGADLSDEELAVACASHGGFPAHVAYVRQILARAGLDESFLQTPPAYPLAEAARDLLRRSADPSPRPVLHNCSGKHAAWLAACVASGWPTAGYLEPDHPLQERTAGMLEEVTGAALGAPGVDGCGAPVYEVSTRGLAKAFARLGNDPRFIRPWTAMHRYPALTSENGRIDQRIATGLNAAAKVGAEGCIGVSMAHGVGIAAKAWDGQQRGLDAGIIGALDALGLLAGFTGHDLVREVVLGGGNPVGQVVPMVKIS